MKQVVNTVRCVGEGGGADSFAACLRHLTIDGGEIFKSGIIKRRLVSCHLGLQRGSLMATAGLADDTKLVPGL